MWKQEKKIQENNIRKMSDLSTKPTILKRIPVESKKNDFKKKFNKFQIHLLSEPTKNNT